MLAFISHANQVRRYAEEACRIFEEHGFDTWLWDRDRPARGDKDQALYDSIQSCDFFVHLCSKHTWRSTGQEIERRFAKVLRKRPFVLLVFEPGLYLFFKPYFVPADVDPDALYNRVSAKTFSEDCHDAVERLKREQLLDASAVERNEGEPLVPKVVTDNVKIGETVIVVKK